MGSDSNDLQPAKQGFMPSSGSVLRFLTNTQYTSAAVFGVFLGVHLTAPIVAAVGGTEAADGVMLLGREYYQKFETLAVYVPLAVHLTASFCKRVVLYYKTSRLPKLSAHSIAGLALVPFVIPHVMLHRTIPSNPNPPISSLSPSEFSYEFVGNAVATRPWMTGGYLILSGLALYHFIVGQDKIASWAERLRGKSTSSGPTAAPEVPTPEDGAIKARDEGSSKSSNASRNRNLAIGGIVASLVTILGVGLYRLAEQTYLSAFTLSRFDAVYAAAPWARLGLN